MLTADTLREGVEKPDPIFVAFILFKQWKPMQHNRPPIRLRQRLEPSRRSTQSRCRSSEMYVRARGVICEDAVRLERADAADSTADSNGVPRVLPDVRKAVVVSPRTNQVSQLHSGGETS
jgi:hypothetical protein